ncbi:acyl carrier protein [Iningainema tapete]|uniref:Acyl carrier protein n=1 Tax=Iningainema tapete BLCC-T55 TaxID=2748662 RepID=A0A8J6XL16_9CYAN|nr:acyl carrier protein [Iningainema tapete]MBD2772806.1 acyl carrier protein [Iningainema tapete BLCC-T55]
MTLELPVIPKLGEVFLAVDLTAVRNMTLAETLKVLENMGYNPTLRYRQSLDGTVSVYALLVHEHVNPEILQNSDYLGEELDALAEVIQPADAITSPRGIMSALTPVPARR